MNGFKNQLLSSSAASIGALSHCQTGLLEVAVVAAMVGGCVAGVFAHDRMQQLSSGNQPRSELWKRWSSGLKCMVFFVLNMRTNMLLEI